MSYKAQTTANGATWRFDVFSALTIASLIFCLKLPLLYSCMDADCLEVQNWMCLFGFFA